MREIHFLSKTNVSKANYSKPFWQTHHELTHRVYLKHRNSISKIFFSRKKIVGRSLEVNVNKVNVNKVNVNKVNVKVNVNKVNDKVNDIYSIHSHYKGNHNRGGAAEGLAISFVMAANGRHLCSGYE